MESISQSVPSHDAHADDAAAVGSVALGALVPHFGSVFAGALDRAVQRRAAAAQHDFNVRIAGFLDQLVEDGFPVTREQVFESEEFAAALMKFSREAIESESSAKRRRLAAACSNSGDWSEFALALRNQFRRLAIDFDDLHIFLLRYFMNPREWLDARELLVHFPVGRGGSPEDPLVKVFRVPQTVWAVPVRQAIADLNTSGLLEVDPDYTVEDDRYLARGTTPKGEKYLRYLAEDDHAQAEPPEAAFG